MRPRDRAQEFCQRFGVAAPILLAPMAGACPASLSIAVANAGGMGACGALLLQPAQILDWARNFRADSAGKFQINLWIPGPAPVRDAAAEAAMRAFLAGWGPAVEAAAGDATPPDFAQQCDAVLAARPSVASSIMGVYPPDFVAKMRASGIDWWATATTVAEALAAEAAGADGILAQGMEAGGHRGAFDPATAEAGMVGLFSLLPGICDAVHVPVIASGGISDARGIAAALLLGASAVQIGTGFLRCPEIFLPSAWTDALATAAPEDTILSRGFSGRAGRAVTTAYARALAAPGAPRPAPYPVQRGLTQAMRAAAVKNNELAGMQAWSGQSARLAPARPAGELVQSWWAEALKLLG